MYSVHRKVVRKSTTAVAAALILAATNGPANSDETTRLAALEAEAPTQQQTLTFGIVPQQSASRLARTWGPLLAQLSEDLGVTIKFETTRDIPTFEACLAAGAYDFVYMNPVHYTIFSDAEGYTALARQLNKRLRGLIVVRKDSTIETLEDLNGANVAFPSPGAFGASVVPRAEMLGRGISFTPDYVKSHDSVYRAVAAGLVPAGGGVLRTFNAISPELRDQLKVIYRTQEYTPHAIASHREIPEELSSALQSALLEMSTSAPALVASVGMNGFETAADQDWDDVRALELTEHDTGISAEVSLTCPSG